MRAGRRMARIRARQLAPAMALLVLAACTGADESADADADGAATPAASAPAPGADQDGTRAPAAAAPSAPAAATATAPADAPVIATARGAVAGQSLNLEVNQFQLDGDLVTLGFTLTTDQPDEFFNHHGVFAEEAAEGGDDYSGVTLVDTANNTRHLVMRDEAGDCLCTDYESFNGTAVVYASFPAPPAGVTQMTVEVPGFQPLRNVAIAR